MRQSTLYTVLIISGVLAINASALVAELEPVLASASDCDEIGEGKSGADTPHFS